LSRSPLARQLAIGRSTLHQVRHQYKKGPAPAAPKLAGQSPVTSPAAGLSTR